jgi:hypothetical protein
MTLVGVVLAAAGCAASGPYSVAVAEKRVVAGCTYIDTLAENSDMGGFQIHPRLSGDARERVLRRAEMLNATHVVWIADYPFGSAAEAYYCAE